MMKVAELGEFALIDLLAKMLARSGVDRRGAEPVLGIGDDAAAFRSKARLQLATTDTMIEDVHFSRKLITWQELGWKALAINLSDIAAMGGIPEYALVALALPGDSEVTAITSIYEGMIEIAQQYTVAIIGGNISRADKLSITITVLGSSPEGKLLRRSAACSGDAIAVTGYLGSAAAGREMLSRSLNFRQEVSTYLREAFNRPLPRIPEGKLLVRQGIKSAIDISDGLIADLAHICTASRLSARVEATRLPIHQAVRENFGEMATRLALGGGEDYELLFTARAQAIERVRAVATCPVTTIGTITDGTPGEITIVDAQGNPVEIDNPGWTHF